ncbi:MAG: M28 family peptidase, partial [Fidelibacterota bacterium]
MKNLPFLKFFFSVSVFIIFGSCQKAIPPTPSVNPNSIKFAGTLALRSEIEFVEQFPYRSSGSSKSLQAVDWLFSKFSSYGLYCETDTWEIVNYSQPVRLKNLICTLPGENQKEIVIIAHHDQSPATIQGADNDGSGIAIMLQLARIFSSEKNRKYTLVFLVSDGEEYGMLGTKRFVETHSNHHNIIAGISLDNLGKQYYHGIRMSPVGQFNGYGPVWLQQVVQESSRQGGVEWIPAMKSVI